MTMTENDRWEIRVNTLGFLANNLRGYERSSILREQLQNADDACHKQGRRGTLQLTFLSDRLVVINPSVFAPDDWRRLREPNSRGKFLDEEQTGEFGVGFWGCLHLTDAPIVTSGDVQATLDPLGVTRCTVPHFDGTRVEFIYRRQVTELSEQLDAKAITVDAERELAGSFVEQMAELLLFTRAIDAIVIELPSGARRTAIKDIEPISPGVERLTVTVEGAPDQNGRYLIVRDRIPDPPKGRHGRVSVALPLSERHRGPGRAFFMFPTETESGLHLSVDGHFRATENRRSLENAGEHGAWNDRIFGVAGRAVGKALETVLDPALHGLDFDDAVGWFAETGSPLPDIARRVGLFIAQLDAEARQRRVFPDRTAALRRRDEVVYLPPPLEAVLGDAVGETLMATKGAATREVFARWGLRPWGAAEVATWLRANLPSVRTERASGPAFVRQPDDALTLLAFCGGQERMLKGVALLLGTDDAYHPIGGPLAKPSQELVHLVDGLARPLVAGSFLQSLGAKFAPETTALWLRDALIESSEQLLGKRMPLKSVAAASKQSHVLEAIGVIRRAGQSLDGVPLALDENAVLQVFDSTTVVGLTQGPHRKTAEQFARRLGRRPLHKFIDDEKMKGVAGQSFGVSLITELIPGVEQWDPVIDSRFLVEVLGSIAEESSISPSLVDKLRSLEIWQGSDALVHTLAELRLAARDRISRSTLILLADQLVGLADPRELVYATFHGLLGVDIMDMTEEVVLACERPPTLMSEQRDLLFELGDCDRLSVAQLDRLRRTPFVLCRDRHLRVPAQVLLTRKRLPLRLGDRCVDEKAGTDRKVLERLAQLGALELPKGTDLVAAAKDIATLSVATDLTTDPSRMMWEYLVEFHGSYTRSCLTELAAVAWLVASPGPVRHRPEDCYDPSLIFAALVVPVPIGIPSPREPLREALKIRSRIETADLVRLGKSAAHDELELGERFFWHINARCTQAGEERKIAELRTEAIIPHTSAGSTRFIRPDRLVSKQREATWGHLRDRVPDRIVRDYPNLLRAWAISADEAVDWQEHVAVLQELASQPTFEDRDRRLAWDRLRSLAELELDEHRLETVFRHGHLVTSLGLKPCSIALRSDLPPTIRERLAHRLPIIEERDVIVRMLDSLKLRSLRSAVALDALFVGEQLDDRWPPILSMHTANTLRFLKVSESRLDKFLIETWPPIVKSVTSLTVKATHSGEVIAEWDAQAHLDQQGEPVLYVNGSSLGVHAIVDAIASVFALKRGTKALLREVLASRSAKDGKELLDDEGIPLLSDTESSYIFVHEDLEIRFIEPAVVDPGQEQLVSEDAPSYGLEGSVDILPIDGPPKSPLPPPAAPVRPTPVDNLPSTCLSQEFLERSELVGVEDEFDPTEGGLLQSPRGTTDFKALEDHGILVVRDLEEEPTEEDYQPRLGDDDQLRKDEIRICLSFFDVSRGLLPVVAKQLSWLTSQVPLREVILFDQAVPARVVGSKHVQVDNGPTIFHSRQIVPGTVMRLYPSVPGTIEVDVRPDLHRIAGVWMLDFDDDGQLTRLRQDNIELHWETDDLFYRAERRLEDIEALMADGGKSAVQLVIEVFQARPDAGLTVEEIWGLVAISRLFAKGTISQILSSQTGLFATEDGRWYMVGEELRVARSPRTIGGSGISTSAPRPSRAAQANGQIGMAKQLRELMRLARELGRLLASADQGTLKEVVQLLGLKLLLEEKEFEQSCEDYVQTGDASLIEAIRREIQRDPALGGSAVKPLESADTAVLAARRPLLDVICANGSAASVIRARALLGRLDVMAGDYTDVAQHADQLVAAHADGALSDAQLWDGVEGLWRDRHDSDPLSDATTWLSSLVNRETLFRQAARSAEPPVRAIEVRSAEIGWLNAQLPGEVFAEPQVQRLRTLLDLLSGATAEVVLDGLHQLAKLAEQAPGGSGDAALLYSLVGAHSRLARVQSKVTERSKKKVEQLKGSAPSETAMSFAAVWAELAHLPMTDVMRPLATRD